MDAATDDRVHSTSAMLVDEGIAEATSVGIGADAEGEVLRELGTLHLTELRAMEPIVTQPDSTTAHDAKRSRAQPSQLTLDNFRGAPLAEPIFALSSVPAPYLREDSEAGSDKEEAGQGCGLVMACSSFLLFFRLSKHTRNHQIRNRREEKRREEKRTMP